MATINAYLYENTILVPEYNIAVRISQEYIQVKTLNGHYAANNLDAEKVINNGRKIDIDHRIIDYCVNLLRLERMKKNAYELLLSYGLNEKK